MVEWEQQEAPDSRVLRARVVLTDRQGLRDHQGLRALQVSQASMGTLELRELLVIPVLRDNPVTRDLPEILVTQDRTGHRVSLVLTDSPGLRALQGTRDNLGLLAPLGL